MSSVGYFSSTANRSYGFYKVGREVLGGYAQKFKGEVLTHGGCLKRLAPRVSTCATVTDSYHTTVLYAKMRLLFSGTYLRSLSFICPVFVHSTSHRFWSEIVMGSAVPSRLNGSPRHNEHATAKRNSVSIPDKN